MGASFKKHDVKLLTYGTLISVTFRAERIFSERGLILPWPQCGGFLAEKWLGKAEPNLYEHFLTDHRSTIA